GEVPQLGQPLADGLALRQAVQVAEGERVFLLYPPLHFGRVEVLHPAIRIRDLAAGIVVDGVAAVRLGVDEPGGEQQRSECPHPASIASGRPPSIERCCRRWATAAGEPSWWSTTSRRCARPSRVSSAARVTR